MAKEQWYRGNIHTHTTESDGDADPQAVVRWFRKHGYDFLVLSDHNHLTLLEYGARQRRLKRPLMIPGEEVTSRIKGGQVPIHINGIGISRVIEAVDAGEILPTIQANVDAIIAAGGIASINHPNYQWAFDHEYISQVTGASMMEVFNGVNLSNTYGAPGRPSAEEIWDRVLSTGLVIWGAAVDDSHHYHDFAPERANPGRGWLMVQAPELSKEAIVDALASGRFYASTGVYLAELEQSEKAISLKVEQEWARVWDNPRNWDEVYRIEFIGRGGVTLADHVGEEATYRVRGDEGYVRARITGSGGVRAWTQPVFTAGSAKTAGG